MLDRRSSGWGALTVQNARRRHVSPLPQLPARFPANEARPSEASAVCRLAETGACRFSDTARCIQYKVQERPTRNHPRRDGRQRRHGLVRFLHCGFRGCFRLNGSCRARPSCHRLDRSAEPKGAAMPLYSYHCAKCDEDIELLVGSSETPVCPTCGSKRLERLVSRTAPEGKSRGIMKAARSQAARAGHLSNFSRSER